MLALVSLVITLLAGIGCKPAVSDPGGLGDTPPTIDANTKVLAAFDPVALAERGTGFAFDAVERDPLEGEPPKVQLPAPALIEWGPIGETTEYADIQFRFNRAVVPLGDHDRLEPQTLGLRIEPELEGELYFAEPDRLVFVPKDALPDAHEYRVSLDAKLQAVDGPTFAAKAAFSFATPGPEVSLWVDSADTMNDVDLDGDVAPAYHWHARVLMDSGDEVTLAQAKAHVHAEAIAADGTVEPVAITLRKVKPDPWGYREAEFAIHPKSNWPAGREVVIRVDARLVGRHGPRPSGREQALSFAVTPGVRVTSVDCYAGTYADGCDLGPLEVRFSAPIPRAHAKRVHVSPSADGFDTLAWDRDEAWADKPGDRYWSVLAWGDYDEGGHYRVHVDPSLRDIHGQSLAGTREFEIDFVEPPPALALANSSGTLVLSDTPRAGIESRHAEQLRLRVAVLDDAAYERLLAEDEELPERSWPSTGAEQFEELIAPAHQGEFAWAATELDFHRFTGGQPAVVLFETSITKLLPRAANRTMPEPKRGLVQISDLGVSVIGSLTDSWVRVADLSTDKPISGASVELVAKPGGPRGTLGETDAEGLLQLPSSANIPASALLRVGKGDDRLLVSIASLRRGEQTSNGLRVAEKPRVAVTTERALYRPGERVRAVGWATITGPYALAGLRPLPPNSKVEFELRALRSKEIVAKRTVAVKAHGKFWATLDVPADAELGEYEVTAKLLDASAEATVTVKDFLAPEFEVTAEAARSDLHHGETTSTDVNARYYFGGGVPMLIVRQAMECNAADFRPPGLAPEWRVAPQRGRWQPSVSTSPSGYPELPPSAEHGHVQVPFVPVGLDAARPGYCTMSVAVLDQSLREVGAETSAWVHPAFYLAASVPSIVTSGADLEIPISTLDFDASPVSVDEISVEVVRHWSEEEYVMEGGKRVYAGMQDREAKLPTCKTQARAGEASCRFKALEHGRYRVTIKANRGAKRDDYQPTIDANVWVPSPNKSGWRWSRTPPEDLDIEVDNRKPKPGDPVRVRVTAPWASGQGVVLVGKGAIHDVRRFKLVDGAAELELTATDAWIPGVELWAVMVEPGNQKQHPSLARASERLSLENDTRRLDVTVDVPREARPRDALPIRVQARDADNRPVRGHVSVWAVDEAVLALAPHELPDFVEAFTVALEGGISFADGYRSLLFPYSSRADRYSRIAFVPGWADEPDVLGSFGYGRGAGAGFGGRGQRAPAIHQGKAAVMAPARAKFETAPIFIGDAELDEHGVAQLSGELPDNLTTFRVTALVSSPIPDSTVEARFGSSDTRVRVSLPLIVRAVLPRILRPGDTAEVGVIVDNLRGGAGELEVEVALDDPEQVLELLSDPVAKRSVAGGDQIRVPVRVRARAAGTPKFIARARLLPGESNGGKTGEGLQDAVELPLPIEPERTFTDRVAVYGTIDDDAPVVLPFALPDAIDPRFGGLSVAIGSSLLGGVEDAARYLVTYPYGCIEQTSSSLLPLIPLGTLAKTYAIGIDDTDAYVEAGVARLRSMQLPSGGFGYWPGDIRPSAHGSAYATWVLGRAAAAGYDVPAQLLERARAYLLEQLALWTAQTAPSRASDIEAAFMLMSLAEVGQAPSEALTKLHERRLDLPAFARALLVLALHRQDPTDPRASTTLAELRSLVDEREASARIESSGTWMWYWDSDVRSSALMLMAMLAVDPEHVLVPKLARGLLDDRSGGRWANTQENAFALLALADYARVYEADEPNFEGRVWIDRSAVARVDVKGRSFEFQHGFAAMPELLEADAKDPDASRLLLQRAGVGRMYYRVGLEWASTVSDLPAVAEGLRIERSLRDADGVLRAGEPIPAGSLLAMDVVIDTRSELTHVAIELPLPAGLEAIDMDLGRGARASRISGSRGWFVSHQELRRDRAVVFGDRIPPGTHTHTVWLRATTPGEYEMPPASAQMMYYPEVYGRTVAERIVVAPVPD